jgi:hypothetical protein
MTLGNMRANGVRSLAVSCWQRHHSCNRMQGDYAGGRWPVKLFVAAIAVCALILIRQSSAQDAPANAQTQQASHQEADSDKSFVAFWRWTTHDPVAFYTFVLAALTGVLSVSTIGLWIVTWRGVRSQSRDTEILERAYLSVEPGGLSPHHDRGDRVVSRVIFHNVGHLPARNVRWYGTGRTSGEDFELAEPFPGKLVLPPGAITTQRVATTFVKEIGNHFFVWGIVTYEDGFGNSRFTRFCHIYITKAYIGVDAPAFTIPGELAELHEHGNDAN